MFNNLYDIHKPKAPKATIRVKGNALVTQHGIRICKVTTAFQVIQGKKVLPLLKELIFKEVRVC